MNKEKLFIQFLKKRRLYAEYCRELEHYQNMPFKELVNSDIPFSYSYLYWISYAFDWESSKRGAKFWTDLNHLWINFCDNDK